jgi:hypothetical protein
VWKPDDDIDSAFKKAKDQTLELVPLYSRISPEDESLAFSLPSESSDSLTGADEFDFDSTLVVFSESKAVELTNKFRKDADAYYVEAKRSTVSSVAQIPLWMYGVLVVLGWNEAMTVLFNPLYFTLLLIALAASYITITLGLVGPLFQVAKTVGGEVQRQVTARLREHLLEPVLAEPVAARAVSRNNSYSEGADGEIKQELNPR